jgi:hypothetical protein
MTFWAWAATFFGTRGRFREATAATVPPDNYASKYSRIRVGDRILLFLKITYFFVLLFPIRVAVQLINILPGIRPINLFRTIFSYMSSVQLYQQRSGRKGGTLVDFDQSLRISIQRRFANGLVNMAERPYSRWYIMAHSLGSVIALKGLMYPDSGFARFMGYNRWHHSRFRFRRNAADVGDYPDKPYKPTWLEASDGVDSALVLGGCRGFISWGSPLETFARTWRQMVHLRRHSALPKDFEWINLYDPVDVVASPLTSYNNLSEKDRPLNFPCRSSILILSAHTSYFISAIRNRHKRTAPTILQWMLQTEKRFSDIATENNLKPLSYSQICIRRAFAIAQWLIVLLVGLYVWPVATGLFIKAIGFIPRQVAAFLARPEANQLSESGEQPEVNWIDNTFRSIEDFIASLQPDLNPASDLEKGIKIITIVAIVLFIGGILHYIIDVILERISRKDRATGNLEIATADYSDNSSANATPTS